MLPIFLSFFLYKKSNNLNFHWYIWIQHEKCIQISTNKPSISSMVLKIVQWILEKQNFDFFNTKTCSSVKSDNNNNNNNNNKNRCILSFVCCYLSCYLFRLIARGLRGYNDQIIIIIKSTNWSTFCHKIGQIYIFFFCFFVSFFFLLLLFVCFCFCWFCLLALFCFSLWGGA